MRSEIEKVLLAYTQTNGTKQLSEIVDIVTSLFGKMCNDVIGEDIDLSKYEDVGEDGGMGIYVSEKNTIATGASIVNLVSYISDKTENEVKQQQRKKAEEYLGQG